jgi:hypothetical protein
LLISKGLWNRNRFNLDIASISIRQENLVGKFSNQAAAGALAGAEAGSRFQ